MPGPAPDTAVLAQAHGWPDGEPRRDCLTGSWTADRAVELERRLAELTGDLGPPRRLVLDLSGIERLDTVGAWILDRTQDTMRRKGYSVDIVHTRPEHETLLREVAAHGFRRPPAQPAYRFRVFSDIGKAVVDAGRDLVRAVSFLGEIIVATTRVASWRHHFRLAAFVHQMELIGLRGVPIIALISFLVGCIIAQQGIFQLRRFGAVPFVVELVGILSLRELGVLLTAIMVAGRSGSSFTAELGSMKMREEIDALRVMGFDPVEILILPRLFALLLALPLLTFVADMAALFGGGLVASFYGDISPYAFLARLQGAIGMNTFMVGILKAPFMAMVIGIVASIEGLSVASSAESLGQHVTSSVVKSIFMVIVADGFFAMFFAAINY
ncbi:ABC transporter permease [Enterovirga sp. CN4-39]|uniref:ABC transporter permease n=1 Tax=Enterovirga sp. CN4-39 TaxID=3400910 RepID=UPI003BFCCBFA